MKNTILCEAAIVKLLKEQNLWVVFFNFRRICCFLCFDYLIIWLLLSILVFEMLWYAFLIAYYILSLLLHYHFQIAFICYLSWGFLWNHLCTSRGSDKVRIHSILFWFHLWNYAEYIIIIYTIWLSLNFCALHPWHTLICVAWAMDLSETTYLPFEVVIKFACIQSFSDFTYGITLSMLLLFMQFDCF